MRALCVDDEAILLRVLEKSVEASADIDEVICFQSAIEALEWASHNPVDIAFLDIQLHKMSGIELASRLKEIYPKLPVVFCTGYDNYAREAFRVHASGYLSKPIYPEDVQEQIDSIKLMIGEPAEKANKLKVNCFGNFEVYVDGKPLKFKRKKSKELLAYLIDRKGATVSVGQITGILWEEKIDDKSSRNNMYQIIHQLKVVLKEAGFEAALITRADGYAVDTSMFDCDYYKYLEGDEAAQKLFNGEYMFQYSWAEETCGELFGL